MLLFQCLIFMHELIIGLFFVSFYLEALVDTGTQVPSQVSSLWSRGVLAPGGRSPLTSVHVR